LSVPENRTTTIYGPAGTREVQHSWTTAEAESGLIPAWLADARQDAASGDMAGRMTRRVYDESTGELVAVLVHPDEYREGEAAIGGLRRMADTAAEWDETYRPNHNAPHVDPDGNTWIPAIDVVHAYLEKQMAKHLGVEVLDAETSHRMLVWAIEISIMFPLTADAAGQVPILTVTGEGEFRWAGAKPIPGTNGLYVREFHGGFWDGSVVCAGSGLRLPYTFATEPAAVEFARAVHAALPGMDWSRARQDTVTEQTVQRIRDVHREVTERRTEATR
jgi:hypothetical protein